MKKRNTFFYGCGLMLLAVSAVLFICFFMSGKTEITNGYVTEELISSLSCTSKEYKYPFFSYGDSDRGEVTSKILFNNDIASSFAVFVSIYTSDVRQSETKATVYSIGLDRNLRADGFTPADFNVGYSNQSDKMVMTMYAKSEKLDDNAKKYFLISGLGLNYSVEQYDKYFSGLGFVCERNN